MNRREFLRFSSTGLAVVAVGSMADWPAFWRGSQALASSLDGGFVELDMCAVDAEMVDGVPVPMWAFTLRGTDHSTMLGGPRIPGPVLVALEGDRVRLQVRNAVGQGGAHGFAIPGVVDALTVPADDQGVEIEFTAPTAGTYLYLDPLNAPVNRVMGLHGALVVLPNPVGNNTPYGSPTPRVQQLFDDLGSAEHFPGNPWDPTRNAVWVLNVIDPDKCAQAAGTVALDPNAFLSGFTPQYFTLNGKSGFFSAQHGHQSMGMAGDHTAAGWFPDRLFDAQSNISLHGTVGQPLVIRSLNAGLMWHAPHIHGNHVYPICQANYLAGGRQVLNNLTMVDTWQLAPGDIRDLLIPFIAPPDIPDNFWQRAAAGTNQELFPLLYPMHDHNEISNTAAGGNYPQGIATHWQIDAPFDPLDPMTAFITVDRAELQVKTGRLLVEGRCSVPDILLDIHAGGANGATINDRIQVDAEGNFRFRGRALKALASRVVTLMHHDPLAPATVHALRSVPLTLR